MLDKFVLLSFFTLIETICLKSGQKHCPRIQEILFRLACIAQKRLCLSSLVIGLEFSALCVDYMHFLCVSWLL